MDPKRISRADRPSELPNRKTLLVQPFLHKNQAEKKPYLLETPIKRKPALLKTPEDNKRQKTTNTEVTEKDHTKSSQDTKNYHHCCCKRGQENCTYRNTQQENGRSQQDNCSETEKEIPCASKQQEYSCTASKQETCCKLDKQENICSKQKNCDCRKKENSCSCSNLPIVFAPVMMPPAFGSIGVPYMIGQTVKLNKKVSIISSSLILKLCFRRVNIDIIFQEKFKSITRIVTYRFFNNDRDSEIRIGLKTETL